MQILKKGKIFECPGKWAWWHSHTMAPSAVQVNDDLIRVFIGCWDNKGISRIGYVDVDANSPRNVLHVSEKPVLDIGEDGMFDENGVFPAHATIIDGQTYLYYTGFQLGHKIPHYNFGGLAISADGERFDRVSRAPILDRADEGLFVRAGQSVLRDSGIYRMCYSVGSGWANVGGKRRPTYDIAYQESSGPLLSSSKGRIILRGDTSIEHGLGRPQLFKYRSKYYIFYTRRTLDMKYTFGAAESSDCIVWSRLDNELAISHSVDGFDSQMMYFPSVVYLPKSDKHLLFYCGNDFGKTGIGYMELFLD